MYLFLCLHVLIFVSKFYAESLWESSSKRTPHPSTHSSVHGAHPTTGQELPTHLDPTQLRSSFLSRATRLSCPLNSMLCFQFDCHQNVVEKERKWSYRNWGLGFFIVSILYNFVFLFLFFLFSPYIVTILWWLCWLVAMEM